MENKNLPIIIIVLLLFAGIYFYFSFSESTSNFRTSNKTSVGQVSEALAAKFNYLSQNGNSSCSVSFRRSVISMPDDAHLQGSCCSPMSMHRYSEQIVGIQKFKSVPGQNIPEIPDDPYDIEAGLAKQLMSYYDMGLTPDEQNAYDYAMKHSHEKGPCCCPCWRWYLYGGLAKFLIRNHGFNGEQVAAVWNLSSGCGRDEEHIH